MDESYTADDLEALRLNREKVQRRLNEATER